MTLEDILFRLLAIKEYDPEALKQDAKFAESVDWEGDEPVPIHGDHDGEIHDIDEITLVYDSDADAKVFLFHP